MRRARSFPALAFACGVAVWVNAACRVDDRTITALPDRIVVDNFEGGLSQPTDRRFTRWEHNVFNVDSETRHFSLAQPGHDSPRAMEFDWQGNDAPDGVSTFPAWIVVTGTIGAIDLSRHTTMSLAHRYQKGDDGCLPLQRIRLSYSCSELNQSFEYLVPVTPDWTVSSPALRDFTQVGGIFAGSAEPCLKVVDSIAIWSGSTVLDGECLSGALQLDDLIIRADGPVAAVDAGVVDGGVADGGGKPGVVACQGSPPHTPLLLGTGLSALGGLWSYMAPGLAPPVVTDVFAPEGPRQALQAVFDPGPAPTPDNTYLGFGYGFGDPPCLDASAYSGVSFKLTGDLGTCQLTFAVISSPDNAVANGPYGRCTASTCLPPSSGRLATGTNIFPFALITGGTPVPTVDVTALNGMGWSALIPSDGTTPPCHASFTISDLRFIDDPNARTIDFGFDDGTRGWDLNDFGDADSGNLASAKTDPATRPTLSFQSTGGDPASPPGALALALHFTALAQHVTVQVGIPPPGVDLRGKTLHAKVRLASGSFPTGGVELHVQTGPGFDYLSSPFVDARAMADGAWVPLTLDLRGTPAGIPADPAQVVMIGVQFYSGDAGAGAPFTDTGEAVFEIDSVTE